MAQDIMEQAEQDALADALVADPEPEPQEIPPEGEEPGEVPDAQDGEEPIEEAADDWLPTEQEKVFPDEVLAKYATRYNIDLAKADPQTRQLVIDKINSDIYLKSLQTQQQEEPEEEEEEEGLVAQPEPTQPPPPPITFDQHIQQIQNIVKSKTSPDMANWVYNNFMKAFGVPTNEIQQLAPQQAVPFVETLSVGFVNLLNTFAPDLFNAFMPQVLEQQFPQFGEMYQVSSAARSWDSVRNDNQDANLPAYGTREYSSAARQIGAEIAGSAARFEAMVFTGKNGQPLSARENLAEKQRMIAERMIQGSQEAPVTPAIVAQAVQTGQKIAQRAAAQRSAGNLGAGKSRAQIAQKDDDIFTEGTEIYNREHGHL